jgi:aconitate decarboxylase
MTTSSAPEPLHTIAEFVADSRAVVLPSEVHERLRLLVLDTLGCGLLGATMPWTAPVIATVAADEPSGAATVWGTDLRASASQAVLANATSVHACELDDVGAGGHHGSMTVTVALALAQTSVRLSGQRLLSATSAGIEVGARFAECLGLAPQARFGFHLPSLIGTFTATTTAADVLDLNRSQCENALATAAQSMTGLLATQHGGMGKRLAAGQAAAAGVRAAQLAAHGFVAAPEVLMPGHGGFFAAVSGGGENFDLDRLTAGLGIEHRALGVSIKMWACRMPIHGALDAFAELRLANPFAPWDIEAISVAIPREALSLVGGPYERPSPAAAQLNLRYCLAAMAVYNDVSIAQFADEVLDAPEIRSLIERIAVRCASDDYPGASELTGQATVSVRLRDGRHLTGSARPRLGEHRPPTAAEVQRKFDNLTMAVTDESQRLAILDAWERLDDLDSVDELARLMARGNPALAAMAAHCADTRMDTA